MSDFAWNWFCAGQWDMHTKRITFNPNIISRLQYDEVEELMQNAQSRHHDVSYSAFYTRLMSLAPAAPQAWATLST